MPFSKASVVQSVSFFCSEFLMACVHSYHSFNLTLFVTVCVTSPFTLNIDFELTEVKQERAVC